MASETLEEKKPEEEQHKEEPKHEEIAQLSEKFKESKREEAEARKKVHTTKRERKEFPEKKDKKPVTPTSERPTRERKVVERCSALSVARSSSTKPLSIKKGRGTQLKDIPNVAFKLSKRKPDDNLQILHTILFGKKAKAYSLKRNIGLFSGFVWVENEQEKPKAKVREKLDKCVKEKLMDFCDVLNIPIYRAVVKKEELSAKLLEFLESPHATTDILLADKEQKGKKHKVTPCKKMSPGEASDTPAKMARVSCKSYFNTVACSRKRKKNGILPVLPDEIIFNILLWLPAEVLFNLMIYVCRKWRKIISDPVFVHEHLFRSTTGLLIQNCSCLLSAHFVEIGKLGVNVKELNFRFPKKILSSLDGLVVFRDVTDKSILHVVNPVTKQQVALPPFSLFPMPCFGCGLGCVRSMGVYKVVCSYADRFRYLKCMIITLGRDNAWRSIDIQHLCDASQGIMFGLYSIGSFIYWACHLYSYILCLDVDAETVSHFSVPEDYHDDSKLLCHKVTGSYLSFLAKQKYELRWNIWLLTDSQKGVWTKLYKIDLEGQRYMIEHMYSPIKHSSFCPIVWLDNGNQLLLFDICLSGPYIMHNVKTGKTTAVVNFLEVLNHLWCHHVSSLVSF